MEARSVDSVPQGPEWQYEPKWDGFRCILVRNNDNVTLLSKSGEDLTRYFPELVEGALSLKPAHLAIDGEIVIPAGRTFSFDDLLQRIHPAASRITKLSRETPALFVAFDLLLHGKVDFSGRPLSDRREGLERLASNLSRDSRFRVSVATTQHALALQWLRQAGGGFDGVIAKRRDLPYAAGSRDAMQKIKRYRSADCVIGGFRYAENKLGSRRVVGSLLLGLYDDGGLLHHVGFTSAIRNLDKAALTDRLMPLVVETSFTGNKPGGPSRWSTKRSSEWVPLKPKLVVEVSYDHFTGGRFRHGTSILRWRPDKKPRQCDFDQLRQKVLSPSKLLQTSNSRGCCVKNGRV